MTNLEKYVKLLDIETDFVNRNLTGTPMYQHICNRLDDVLEILTTSDFVELTKILINRKLND